MDVEGRLELVRHRPRAAFLCQQLAAQVVHLSLEDVHVGKAPLQPVLLPLQVKHLQRHPGDYFFLM